MENPIRRSHRRVPHLAITIAVLATAALLAVTPAAAGAAPGGVATPSTPVPDGPVSDQLVPALRGDAADAAVGELTTQRLRHIEASRPTGTVGTADIVPWEGSLHTGWGAFPYDTSTGAQATHTVNPRTAMSPGDPDVVYAPTLMPGGTSCIEVSTFYWQGGNGVGAWNWCSSSPGFQAVTWINADFVAAYTVPFNGLPAYTVRDVQTDPVTNTWTAYLFNHITMSWDELFTSADPDKLGQTGGGWDMFEVYTEYNPETGEGYYCTETYGSMWWATGIQYRLGGVWRLLTPDNSSVPSTSEVRSIDFGCYSLSFTLQEPNSNWQVTH